MVINPDTNELEYTIGWSAIGSENGCAGYQIYVQPEGETAAALGALVPVRGGTCSVSRSLEDYAGKTIDLYLVAVATDDSGYADSPNGIVYTMTVPMRLNTPSVKWSYNWNATATTRFRRPASEAEACRSPLRRRMRPAYRPAAAPICCGQKSPGRTAQR